MDATMLSLGTEAAPVRWEPCALVCVDDAARGLCADCGWPVDDHTRDEATYTPARAA